MNVLVVTGGGETAKLVLPGPPEVVVTTVHDRTAALQVLQGASVDAIVIGRPMLDSEGLGLVSTLRAAGGPSTAILLRTPVPRAGEVAVLRRVKLCAGVDDLLLGDADAAVVLRQAVRRRRQLMEDAARDRAALIVDDQPGLRELIDEALQRAGWRTLSANDPYRGLELLAESAPAVVFTDLVMPDLSGTELVAAALRFDAAVVPIVITGYPTFDAAIESLRAGAVDFILKPFTPDQVVAAAERSYTRRMVGGCARVDGPGAASRKVIRVLLVEDREDDERLLRLVLKRSHGERFAITTARSLDEALALLPAAPGLDMGYDCDFDVALLDLGLPDSRGVSTFAKLHVRAPYLPVVVLTGLGDGAVAEQVILAGAQECLVKRESSAELIATRLHYAIDRSELLGQLSRRARDVRASHASRRRLIEGNLDGMLVLDRDGGVLFANQAAETMFDRTRDGLLGANLEIGLDRDGEVEVTRAAGRDPRWLSVRIAPIEWSGQVARLASLHDITDRKVAESLRDRLAHADRLIAVGQLAAGVAHEINNPAAFILTNLELLAENIQTLAARSEAAGDHEILRESAELVRDGLAGIQRITKIVRDMRGFSREEQDTIEMVDLNAVIQSARSIAHNEIRHRAQLVLELAPLPPIAGDRTKLGQVVVNLLVNAAQAIEGGGADQPEIHVATRHAAGKLHLTVSDRGCGIAPKDLSRIFEPFFTTKAVFGGTGLGLSISGEIVRRHGGAITVRSELGKGTTFEVVLPEDTGLAPLPRASEGAVVNPSSPAVPQARARILLTDDEPLLRRAFGRMLTPHEVVQAASGVEALAIVRQDQAFDVVLCDLMMEDLDGPGLYDALGEEFPALTQRVVFITGGAFTPRVRAFLKRVRAPVLEKPITREDLLRVVERMVGMRAGGGRAGGGGNDLSRAS
jgi:signal transduction histidine kinase